MSKLIVQVQKVGSIIGRKGELVKKMCKEARAFVKILEGAVGLTDRLIGGLPTDKRQPILAICEHETIVEENNLDLVPKIFTEDGQQKGQLRASMYRSGRSYDIIVECV